MGRSCFDYEGYGQSWLCKSDLTPKNLRRYGIKVSVKDIKQRSNCAITGTVVTGGRGHSKHVYKYSIRELKELFNK